MTRESSVRAARRVTCCEFLYIFCCPPCPRRITEKIAFQPPKPPSYDLVPTESQAIPFAFHMSPNVNSTGVRQVLSQDARFVKTSQGNNIAVLHIKATTRKAFTIIFSHGNAVDLGQVHRWLTDMSLLTGCDVVSYDYSGYGQSEGHPTERNIYADVRAAWDYTLTFHEPNPQKIILFGLTLGCVATAELATKVSCAGVVLQSPITSSYRFLFPHKKDPKNCFGTLKCIDKVRHVQSPTLVIHGTNDEIIDISHGIAIHENCANAVEPLWVEGANHNIEQYRQYVERLRRFINEEIINEEEESGTDESAKSQ